MPLSVHHDNHEIDKQLDKHELDASVQFDKHEIDMQLDKHEIDKPGAGSALSETRTGSLRPTASFRFLFSILLLLIYYSRAES